jgi:hypothetical protein
VLARGSAETEAVTKTVLDLLEVSSTARVHSSLVDRDGALHFCVSMRSHVVTILAVKCFVSHTHPHMYRHPPVCACVGKKVLTGKGDCDVCVCLFPVCLDVAP